MLITIERLLLIALIAAPIPCRAADPAPAARAAAAAQSPSGPDSASASRTLQNLDRMIRELTEMRSQVVECFALESSLKSDHAKKKAQLSAEFRGKIPAAFNDLLWKKTTRIAKQHKECFEQYMALGGQFEALDLAFKTIEPKSLNVKKQRAIADQEKQKHLLMMPTTKPNNKMPKPASVTE